METSSIYAKALQGEEDAEARREAARALGRARTPRKAEAARENGKKAVLTEAQVAKHRQAQQDRRERERREKEAAGVTVSIAAPLSSSGRGPGRPRTRAVIEPGEKRGRGRPLGSLNKPKEEVHA